MVLSTGVLGNIIHFLIPECKYMNCFTPYFSPSPPHPLHRHFFSPSMFPSVRKKIRVNHLLSFPTGKFSAPTKKMLNVDREGYSGTTFPTCYSHTRVQPVRCRQKILAKQLKKYNHGRKKAELRHSYFSVYIASKPPVICAQTIQLQISCFFHLLQQDFCSQNLTPSLST